MEPGGSEETLSVTGGHVRVDTSSGALTAACLADSTGSLLHHTERAGLVRIAMPTHDYPAHHVEAGTHGAPHVERVGNRVRLVYDSLSTPLGPALVRLEVDIEAYGSDVHMHATVQNLGTDDIPQVVFPQIFGLENMSGPESTRVQLARGRMYPFRDIDVRPEDAHFLEVHRQRYFPFGNREHSMKWFDYGSEHGGFALYSCDTRYTTQGLVIERFAAAPEHSAIRWVHYPFIKPGETWESGDFILHLHTGDWYAGARAYQRFALEAYPYNAPRRIREALGIRTIWPAVRGERPTFPFSKIDEYAAEIADPDLGLAELCIWHWWRTNGYPIVLDPRLGTEDDLRASLQRCRELGVPVSLFVSHHLVRDEEACDDTMVHHNSAHQRVQQNWTYGLGFVPRFGPSFSGTHALTQGSALSPEWRRMGLEEYRKLIEMGATSICFDQFRAWPEPNFNPDIDGRPDEEGEKLLEFAHAARDLIHRSDPSGTFSGEHMSDVKVSVLDYTWEWKNRMADAAPLRYVFPQVRINANINEHPRGALLGFMEGALLNVIPGDMRSLPLRDLPQFVAMLKRLAALRRRFLPYFTEGQFRFQEGLMITGGDARIYTHEDGILIIAVNPTDRPADVTIAVDPATWGAKPILGALVETGLDGSTISCIPDVSGTFYHTTRLEPDTLRILEFIPGTSGPNTAGGSDLTIDRF